LDKYAVFVEDTVVVEGAYYSSRMVGDYVYTIVRKYACVENNEANLPAIYKETECHRVQATEVYYFDKYDYSYYFTTIAAFNVKNPKETLVYETFLTGYTTAIYVSTQNIYLTTGYSNPTSIYRIHFEEGEIEEAVKGEVNGQVLNQFSMDEYKGYFRIATTCWRRVLENNLYVLNMDMKVVGCIEGIAPREKIHSARFMGKLCYLVTFEKVDPFFVIDLSNPYFPRILGELKITGYSDYLHLYDKNHVIGIGKETVEAQQGSFSWYQGVKISLFNVENLNNPKELAKYVIGHRGTDSPVLTDHKAFLFSKERNLLVIPVIVAEINPNKYFYGVPPNVHGRYVWQGTYVFNISTAAAEKIMLRGKITHVSNGNLHNSDYHVTRALYIGDVLYTISENMIKMHSLSDLAQINTVSLYP
ncbi:MAG: beta-propeller domain-containing protein, partial [Candidatus Bathyarchaeia archaeon]